MDDGRPLVVDDFLRARQCDEGQGFISAPRTAAAFAKRLTAAPG